MNLLEISLFVKKGEKISNKICSLHLVRNNKSKV